MKELLANPNNWFPPVDQVDRPYFISVDKKNRVYSEFTDFNVLRPAAGHWNNWYEEVDRKAVSYFVVKGRYGFYWVDLNTGLIFVGAQHEEGKHPLTQFVIGLQVQEKVMTASHLINEDDDGFIRPDYMLKHFKVSDVELMGAKAPVMGGMNTRPFVPELDKKGEKTGKLIPIPPVDNSQTSEVIFGWEVDKPGLGRITFEGIVFNRRPQFDIRLIYSLPPKYPVDEKAIKFQFMMWDAQRTEERIKHKVAMIRKGEKFEWQERIL